MGVYRPRYRPRPRLRTIAVLSGRARVALAGVSAGVATVTSTLSLTRGLAGVSAGVATVSGTLRLVAEWFVGMYRRIVG